MFGFSASLRDADRMWSDAFGANRYSTTWKSNLWEFLGFIMLIH
jgi:hypothetical protein